MSAPYPPAPWQLRGASVQAFRLVDVERARGLVPPDLRVVPVLPGRTIAVVYCARYGPGSSLLYSELAVAPALVESGGKLGFWISHIYVDNPSSVAGGREIWQLPKQLAHFAWNHAAREVAVTQDWQTLCRIAWKPRLPLFRLPLLAPILTQGNSTFWLRGSCEFARCRAEISADPESPVAGLSFTSSRHVLAAPELTLTIPAL
jgi:acetoacetate decarboxylase